MPTFKKLLASVGIGAAKVDTRLYNDCVIPIEVLLEIDTRPRGVLSLLDEAIDIDERYARLFVTKADIKGSESALAQRIDGLIQQVL